MSTVTRPRATIADYERLPEGAPYQLIDGELIMTPSPAPFHQIVSARLEFALMGFVIERGLGTVLDAPIDIVLSEGDVYQPDIIFIRSERRAIIGEKNIQGAPDLVVEILSPSTAYYDLRTKRDIYEKAGVQEYWVVDPMGRQVEVFANRDGLFSLAGQCRGEGRIESQILPGFSVDIASLFQQ